MKLSIILPSIRNFWVERFTNSIDYENYELIIVGPNVPPNLSNKRVKWYRDYGSPVRASQIALSLCTGDIVTYAADDAVYYSKAIERSINLLLNLNVDFILNKYTEGGKVEAPNTIEREMIRKGVGRESFTECGAFIQSNSYFLYGNAYPIIQTNRNDYIFNSVFARRSTFEELGGWDCNFQACPLAHADMGIRAYNSPKGYRIHFDINPIFHCDPYDSPGNIDHDPIGRAQELYDTNYLKQKYSRHYDINISLDNWKDSPSVWTERFSSEI